MSLCGISPAQAKEKFIDFVGQSIALSEDQAAFMFPSKLPAGSKVASYLKEEFEMDLTADAYLSWVVSDPFSLFSQECKILLLDPVFSTVSEFNLTWWPQVDGVSYRPSEDDLIIGGNYESFDDLIYDFEEVEHGPNNTRSIALLCSGYDPLFQNNFRQAIEVYSNNLRFNPLGPKLNVNQVAILESPSKAELQAELEMYNKLYDTVQFYYVGHAYPGGHGKEASIAVGNGVDTWYPLRQLANDIVNTKAESFKVVMDCSWTDPFINEFKLNPSTCLKKVEVLTSSCDDQPAKCKWQTRDGENIVFFPYSNAYNACSSDPLADLDNNGVIEFSEMNSCIQVLDPFFTSNHSSIYDVTCPSLHSGLAARKASIAEIDSRVRNTLPEGGELLADIYLDTRNSNGLQVINEATGGIEIEVAEGFNIGCIDYNKSDFFPKLIEFFTISYADECEDLSIEYVTVESSDFPTIRVDDKSTSLLKEEKRTWKGRGEVLPIDDYLILADYEVPPPADGKGGLLVHGYDPRDQFVFDFFTKVLGGWAEKYSYESVGPAIVPEQVEELSAPSLVELCNKIDQLKNKYENHFYFYFVGHGTVANQMRLGPGKEDVITMQGLFEKLGEMSTDTMTIVIDSKIQVDSILILLEESTLVDKHSVYIQTAMSDDDSPQLFISEDESRVQTPIELQILQPLAAGFDSDLNNDDRVHPFESFVFSKKSSNDLSVEVGLVFQNTFDLGLTFGQEPWIFFDWFSGIEASLYYTSNWGLRDDVLLNGPNFLAGESTLSTYISDGIGFRDCTKIDFRYSLKNPLDVQDSSNVVLALIYRKNGSEEWDLVENQSLSMDSLRIEVLDQEVCGEFKLVTLEETSTVQDINGSDIGLVATPSIFRDELKLQFANRETADISVNVVALDGRVVKSKSSSQYSSGVHTLSFDTSTLEKGTYIVQLVENNRKTKLISVVRQ